MPRAPQLRLEVTFFNAFQLIYQGEALPLDELSAKPRSVLAYLLYRAPQVVPPAQLNDRFWPVSWSNNSVFNAISTLRQWSRRHLPVPLILTTAGGKAYFINPDIALQTDCSALRRWYLRGTRLQAPEEVAPLMSAVLQCYTGRFGHDLAVNDWTLSPAHEAEEQLAGIFRQVSKLLRRHGQAETIIDWGLQMHQHAPGLEEVYYQLALAYQQCGWESRALRQIHICREVLQQRDEACSSRLRSLEAQLREGIAA